jgi:hypothetical protein
MKKYVLVIDPSSSKDSNLYVEYFQTINDAKQYFNQLNLDFTHGVVYCALIGKSIGNNRYMDHLRTDDGKTWIKQEPSNDRAYQPLSWSRIGYWSMTDEFSQFTNEVQ